MPFLCLGPALAAGRDTRRQGADNITYLGYDEPEDDDYEDEAADDTMMFEVRGPDMDSVARRGKALSGARRRDGSAPSSSRKASRQRMMSERARGKSAAAAAEAEGEDAEAAGDAQNEEEVPKTFMERLDDFGEAVAQLGQKLTLSAPLSPTPWSVHRRRAGAI